jgi:hypothetical protein
MYRYVLWRKWNSSDPKYLMFIGLNPSTADELNDDPTVRRFIGYAKQWGYNAVCVTNLFAYRATRPAQLKAHPEPVGSENDTWLVGLASAADLIVAAWGVNGTYRNRNEEVLKRLPQNIMCLRETRNGQPAHPLYLPKWVRPLRYRTGGNPNPRTTAFSPPSIL